MPDRKLFVYTVVKDKGDAEPHFRWLGEAAVLHYDRKAREAIVDFARVDPALELACFESATMAGVIFEPAAAGPSMVLRELTMRARDGEAGDIHPGQAVMNWRAAEGLDV